jgi:micrococcal nuclease
MDEHYLNLFKDFVLDFHGIMFWAKKETSKGMKLKLFPILILFLMIIPGVVFAGQYKVVRVVDGHTIVIRYNGKYEKVRLRCINTPKSVPSEEKQSDPIAEVAFRYTQKKLTGKYVDLEFESWSRGRFGVLFAYVFVDAKNINLELVRQGLSRYYIKYGQSKNYHNEFKIAEELARKEKLNIWSDHASTKK